MYNCDPTFGIILSNRGPVLNYCTSSELIDMGVRAEESRMFNTVWAGDAFLTNPRLDAIALLSAVAAKTTDIRIGPACMGSFTQRGALDLAYQWASLDQIANGRSLMVACAGGGGGWSSEIIKAPKICNSSFKHQRIFNKLVVPIKKIVLTTKSSSYHKNNNIQQKLIIKDFMLNVHNDNSVEYDVIQTPQLNNKVHKYETSYNNINSNSSISFIFNNPISDYDFKMNVSVLSTNNDNNNCDLELYDERNRKIIIEVPISHIN